MSLDPYSLVPAGLAKKSNSALLPGYRQRTRQAARANPKRAIAAAFENARARSMPVFLTARVCCPIRRCSVGRIANRRVSPKARRASWRSIPRTRSRWRFRRLKLVQENKLIPALNSLQDSLESIETDLPETVYNAMQLISQALLSQGHNLASARLAHALHGHQQGARSNDHADA